MLLKRIRRGVLLLAMSAALSGCANTADYSQACGGITPNGDRVGYTCPRTPGYP